MEFSKEMLELLDVYKKARPAGRLDSFYGALQKLHEERFAGKRFGELIYEFICWLCTDRRRDPFFPEEKSMLAHLNNYAEKFGSEGEKAELGGFYEALKSIHKCNHFVDWRFGQLMVNYFGWLQGRGIEPQDMSDADFICNLAAFEQNKSPLRRPMTTDNGEVL